MPLKIKPVWKPNATTALTPVQSKSLVLAKGRRGFGYFLDMGLGKTLLALTEFDQLVLERVCTRLVVIAPNSFKSGWRAEILKHGFNFNVHVYESGKHAKAVAWSETPFDRPPVLIVNYEAARLGKTIALIEAFTGRVGRTMLILDESIAIKNPQAVQTKRILAMVPWFERIRLLTGRPMTQGPHDLWAQLRAIGAYDRNFYGFRNTFCRMGGWQGKQIIGSQNEDQLQAIMAPHTFQASKAEWLKTLLPKTYTTRDYDLGPILGPKYREMEAAFLVWLKKHFRQLDGKVTEQDKAVSVSIAIAQYQKLLQIQCGFVHDESGEANWLVPDDLNPRIKLLMETLDESSGKVCIVYAHRAVGEQLVRVLTRDGFQPAAITGGMKPAAIEAEKTRFNGDPACRVILLQADASKYGHTLLGEQSILADRCSTMIFYQNSYSLDTRTQIEDRIHRIGQNDGCLYVDFAGTSMDRHMVAALQHKQSMYDAVMGAGGIAWGR